jgi:hypothetical protein
MYTSAAINAINELFPSRTVSLITGDSNTSVPNFVRLIRSNLSLQQFACNVLFIDGSHYFENAYQDIQHMRQLANRSYHRIIIDDGDADGVKQAWNEAVRTNIISVLDIKKVNQTLCNMATRITDGPYAGSYEFDSLQPDCVFPLYSSLEQDSLIIAEYKFA